MTFDGPGGTGAADEPIESGDGVDTYDTVELTGNWGRRRKTDDRPVLPRSTRDDTDAGWGERPTDSDAWLREQRPPHWD